MNHRPTSHQNSTTAACYNTLVLAIAPIAIYLLQIFGKVSTVAATLAGALIILKALVEWQAAMRQIAQQKRAATLPKPAKKLVQVLPPIAGCYLCQQQRPLQEYHLEDIRVGVCADCHSCLSHTYHRI